MARTSLIARLLLFLALLLFPFVVACGNTEEPTSSGGSGSDFTGRLEAASGISSTAQRDLALQQIALDAGKSSSGAAALEAISGISSMAMRDETARDAAISLAEDGHASEATELANTISSTSMRDETLAAIATTNS